MRSSVWDREYERGDGILDFTLSRRLYLTAVTLFTAFGIVLATVIAVNTRDWTPSIWVWLGVGLGVPILGIFIAHGSDHWPTSFLGYVLVAGGLGAITGPVVAFYDTGVVVTAFMATAGATIVMSVIGIIYPKSLEGWAPYLFGGLIALVFVRIAQAIMAGMGVSESLWYMPIIEYLGAILFMGYIIYDWNRALRLPYTLDNAVDAAVAIFLDVINLFLILLRIVGGRGSSK